MPSDFYCGRVGGGVTAPPRFERARLAYSVPRIAVSLRCRMLYSARPWMAAGDAGDTVPSSAPSWPDSCGCGATAISAS